MFSRYSAFETFDLFCRLIQVSVKLFVPFPNIHWGAASCCYFIVVFLSHKLLTVLSFLFCVFVFINCIFFFLLTEWQIVRYGHVFV